MKPTPGALWIKRVILSEPLSKDPEVRHIQLQERAFYKTKKGKAQAEKYARQRGD